MNSTPSIGTVGVTVDQPNRRVKYLSDDVFCSVDQVRNHLAERTNNHAANELLAHTTARFTSRIIVKGVDYITPFTLPCGVVVREEARIHTAMDLDVVYVGGNTKGRIDETMLADEEKLSVESARLHLKPAVVETSSGVSFEQLCHHLSNDDADQLIEMYQLCFTSYPVQLNKALVQAAAKGSIFSIARNNDGRIVASAIGESLRVGPLTFLEISEVASHPIFRIKGAASGCSRMVIEKAKQTLDFPVVAFWEARMWRNVLGIAPSVGLTEFGGILHQHCRISSTAEFTSLRQTAFGSLAVFYAK